MIQQDHVAVVLFMLSASAANAAILCTLSATGIAFGEVSNSALTDAGVVIACVGNNNTNYTVTLTTGLSGTMVCGR